MKRWKQYVINILLSALFLVYMMSVPVYAEDTGIPTGVSEKVYAEMSVDGGVVGNIIKGETFSILSAELDASKNVWYMIQMNTGTVGYMQAASVTRIGAGEARQESGTQEAEGESEEDSGGGQTQTGDEQTEINSERLENEEIPIENGSESLENDGVQTDIEQKTVQSVQAIRGVNIRKSTSTKSEIAAKVPPNVVLECIGTVENQAGEIWYEVIYQDIQGYVKKSAVREFKTGQPQNDADLVKSGPEETESGELPETALSDAFQDILVEDNGSTFVQEPNTKQESEPEAGIANDMEIIYSEELQEQRILYVDWVLALSALGALLCTITAFCLLRRVMKLSN